MVPCEGTVVSQRHRGIAIDGTEGLVLLKTVVGFPQIEGAMVSQRHLSRGIALLIKKEAGLFNFLLSELKAKLQIKARPSLPSNLEAFASTSN